MDRSVEQRRLNRGGHAVSPVFPVAVTGLHCGQPRRLRRSTILRAVPAVVSHDMALGADRSAMADTV
jgi:hypothetical protein